MPRCWTKNFSSARNIGKNNFAFMEKASIMCVLKLITKKNKNWSRAVSQYRVGCPQPAFRDSINMTNRSEVRKNYRISYNSLTWLKPRRSWHWDEQEALLVIRKKCLKVNERSWRKCLISSSFSSAGTKNQIHYKNLHTKEKLIRSQPTDSEEPKWIHRAIVLIRNSLVSEVFGTKLNSKLIPIRVRDSVIK